MIFSLLERVAMGFRLDTSKKLYYHSPAKVYNFFIYVPSPDKSIKTLIKGGFR